MKLLYIYMRIYILCVHIYTHIHIDNLHTYWIVVLKSTDFHSAAADFELHNASKTTVILNALFMKESQKQTHVDVVLVSSAFLQHFCFFQHKSYTSISLQNHPQKLLEQQNIIRSLHKGLWNLEHFQFNMSSGNEDDFFFFFF